jgi:transposase
MQIFIDYVAQNHPDRHILMFLDQASFHTTDKLILPGNMTFFPILAHSPELNPVEVLWLYIRSHYFKNDYFDSIDDVSDRLLFAFSELLLLPDVIKSIAGWKWILDTFDLE